jgi:hypothetical protein
MTIGGTLRKTNKSIISKKALKQQFHKLHNQIKKEDQDIQTIYSIEKNKNGGYHIHYGMQISNLTNLKKCIEQSINGYGWTKALDIYYNIDKCIGQYGEISLFNIINNKKYNHYISKFYEPTQLY